MQKYVIGIDQSTSGTKALLFDERGVLKMRCDKAHRQIVDDRGWVEHDPEEIRENTISVVGYMLARAGISLGEVACVGISNQRETAMVWDRDTGKPLYNAIVWQCARGEAICKELEAAGASQSIKQTTGLHLSPYFSAAKIAWILRHIGADETQNLCCGTMDSWLAYSLCKGHPFVTEFANAARTQLFDIAKGCWSDEMCALFGIPKRWLAEVKSSDALFGQTDFDGLLPHTVPVHGMLGDSNGALFGQGCFTPGSIKCTYGTGSSVMMNIGQNLAFSDEGVVTSIAWKQGGKLEYVFEGNINYTGAVMKWVVEDLGLLINPREAGPVAAQANAEDETVLVPAFSGLNAPHWDSGARALIYGMGRTTGKAELVKAAEECVAYQISDIVEAMVAGAGVELDALHVDGGPTRDGYLMQFQSDILATPVVVPQVEELSGLGAAYLAGIAAGVYRKDELFSRMRHTGYTPKMAADTRRKKLGNWKQAVGMVLHREER